MACYSPYLIKLFKESFVNLKKTYKDHRLYNFTYMYVQYYIEKKTCEKGFKSILYFAKYIQLKVCKKRAKITPETFLATKDGSMPSKKRNDIKCNCWKINSFCICQHVKSNFYLRKYLVFLNL